MKRHLIYIAVTLLFTGMVTAQKIDLNAMPKPGPVPVINIEKPKTFQLNNGLTVMVVENRKLPQVTANLYIENPLHYQGNIVGVSQVMAEQLGNGSINLKKEEFNKKVDFMGAELAFNAEGASASSLSKYFPEIIELMADAIIHPKFSPDEIQNSKQRMLEALKSKEKDASFISTRVSRVLQYGKNSPKGQFVTIESVGKIQPDDVKNFYQKYYSPENAYLVIVGDIKYDQVKSLIDKTLSGWKKSNTIFSAVEPVSNVAQTEINIIDLPTAVQSFIRVQNIHSLKMKEPNYFPAIAAMNILAGDGDVSSRLNMNLREKNGFTYGAGASLKADRNYSDFGAGASVRNEVTDKAVQEFINELNLISTVKTEELEKAKAKLKGDFILSLESPQTLADLALNQKIEELPSDFYTNYLKSIDKVTTQDISTVAASIILPKQSLIVIVGKASDISKGLENLGYPVKYFDQNANPIKK